MTESDFQTIEASLGITLPPDYKRLMRSDPLREYVGHPVILVSLLYDPKALISLNWEWRERGFSGLSVPPTYFCFAALRYPERELEMAWFLDLSVPNSPVYLADSVLGEKEQFYKEGASLEAWIQWRTWRWKRIANKKWWQFWV